MQPLSGQGQSAPRWEVTSVKRSAGCNEGAGRAGGRSVSADPGRLDVRCLTVMDLIRTAYAAYRNGQPAQPRRETPISGGPGWIDSERYDIDAKPEGPQSQETMRGPMMQALLEDRFRLKIHRETREVPVYALTVAKGGPKLQAAQEGKCFSRDADRSVQMSQRALGLLPCGVFAPSKSDGGPYMYSTTLENFCLQISQVLDRDVIDKTGITGLFDIHVDAPPPEDAASASDALSSAVFDAVRIVGLRLEPSKGSGEFLMIDRVEKPADN